MRSIKTVHTAIVVCAALFIVILALTAYLDKSIRVLHIFEAIPYIVGPMLCLRRNRFGYFLTFASGAFWLWGAGFLTTFVRNGFEQLTQYITTGTADRFDVLIAVPAAIATAGLVLFSLIGYSLLPKKAWKDIVTWLFAIIVITAFFLAIFKLFAPRYLEMFNGIFW